VPKYFNGIRGVMNEHPPTADVNEE